MKKIIGLILVALLTFPTVVSAQQQLTRVVLKNNTTLTGVLKEFNPTSHIIISISGIDSRIEMSDVIEVSQVDTNSKDEAVDKGVLSTEGVSAELLMKEEKNYPTSFMLDIAGEQVEMIYIKGGVFSMGYDGKGSLMMKSEPVHPVFVSGFYISRDSLTEGLVDKVYGKKVNEKNLQKPFQTFRWEKVDELVSMIAEVISLPVRLPTEAEWEYVVSQNKYSSLVIFKEGEVDFCYDIWAPYPSEKEIIINPKGPNNGYYHVRRKFGTEKATYCARPRYEQTATGITGSNSFVRIVIPAENTLY